jgi:ABC-type transporter Mla MlaB component
LAAVEEPREPRVDALRHSAMLMLVGGPIALDAIPRLCERLRVFLDGSHAECVVCDVDAVAHPDAATVDALARLQLTAKRSGRDFRLRGADGELRALLALAGLRDILPPWYESVLDLRSQTEQREQAGGVEEGIEPDDLAT